MMVLDGSGSEVAEWELPMRIVGEVRLGIGRSCDPRVVAILVGRVCAWFRGETHQYDRASCLWMLVLMRREVCVDGRGFCLVMLVR